MAARTFRDYATSLAAASAGIDGDVVGLQSGTPVRFQTIQPGLMSSLALNSSRVMTLADTRGGVITPEGPGNVVLTIPTFAVLGHTRNASNPQELILLYQRGGLGRFFITPATGVTIKWGGSDNTLYDPQYLPQWHAGPRMLITRGDNFWVAG